MLCGTVVLTQKGLHQNGLGKILNVHPSCSCQGAPAKVVSRGGEALLHFTAQADILHLDDVLTGNHLLHELLVISLQCIRTVSTAPRRQLQ